MTEQQSSADHAFDRRAIPAEAVETRWRAADGHPIRRIEWLIPNGACRGSLLFLPGRGDAYEKYLELLDHWYRKGWRVTAADWRGQAGSGRLGADAVTGHVDDFSIWVDDLAAFWGQWKSATPPPHVLIGHSMGGQIVLRALAEERIDPDAVVLSAPMLGFKPGIVPAAFLHWLARRLAGLGDPRRPAWTWGDKPGVPPQARIELLTHDHERYADELWWREARPELVMGPASWGWLERALASIRLLERPGVLERISVPALMLAPCEDRLVNYAATERAARRMPRAQLIRFGSESRHEILRETDAVRDKAVAAIDEFLDRVAPVID